MSDARESSAAAFSIRRATREEATDLAILIREAFLTEAEVYGDIPPLHETAADIEATFDANDVTLVADIEGRTIGTVRGETMRDGTLIVRRLAVLPEARRLGVGRALLLELEACYPATERFELFTGSLNGGALGLYESLGYARTGVRKAMPGVDLITLEKRRAD
jgi:ribosomal protein S18 acetylase RimI-like enzyme